ncbi:MAG: sulfite exporter TauE/SafE family protein [Candidatus Sericytochromatia bacterium]|nr:sulfite exporter TauE/SafE family protein [Candidatus Tanganyikabacteria bacterium]
MTGGYLLGAVSIGIGTGVLSGFFGVGGGIVSTPAIRVLLDVAPLIALGTPLPVTLPSAISGGLRYARQGLVDLRVAAWAAAAGVPASVLGAWATAFLAGELMMVLTAILIAAVGLDFASGARERRLAASPEVTPEAQAARWRWLLVGAIVGFVSGFLGIGGGVLAVPIFVAWLRMPIKRAFGTSLILVALIALPGSLVHLVLGHVDLVLAGLLTLGVVPGAWLGAGLAARLSDGRLIRAFGVFLLCVAVAFGYQEVRGLLDP